MAPANGAWPGQFQRERDRLLAALPGRFVSIEHIGSTAVPGLAAKPVIDMLGGVTSMAAADALLDDLCAMGYTTSVEYNATLTDRRWLMRHANGRRTHHLHLVVYGADAWRSRIAFRDALRADTTLRQRYLELKQQLAAQYAGDREAYARGKLPFIAQALHQAGLALAEPPPARRPPRTAARAPELLRAAQAAEQAAYAAGAHLLASRSRLAALVFTREQPDAVASQIRHETETMIRDVLRKRFPSHGFLGDEDPGRVDDAAPRWVVDPLDGSANYLRGQPRFAVSIALVVGGEPQIGVVYDPSHREFFGAIHGVGAVCNGAPIHCADLSEPCDAIASTLFPEPSNPRAQRHGAELARALHAWRSVRRAGSAALEMAYVAAGRTGVFWGHDLSTRDTAAGIVLARESGAQLVRPDTLPVLPSASLAVCAPGLHEAVIHLLTPR
ncbi:MAG TPA: inositol monophosphatase family protein [Albitalea sp.]|nr:inositol monophosphatase family protein [Albitalea sp.]